MEQNLIELAWAAGFFDGEGNFRSSGKTVAASIKQIHPYVLKRFKKAVNNLGEVNGPYKQTQYAEDMWGLNRQPQWHYQCQNYEGVKEIIHLLWPYLSKVKKRQANGALKTYHNAPYKRKLTPKQLIEIKKRLTKGEPVKEISARYNVTRTVVYRIKNYGS